jgi:hypothetical protein
MATPLEIGFRQTIDIFKNSISCTHGDKFYLEVGSTYTKYGTSCVQGQLP